MADTPNGPGDETRRRPRVRDVFTFLAGLATLFMSVYLLSDGRTWFPATDPRWLLAGGAVVVGLVMLAGSVRPRRDRR